MSIIRVGTSKKYSEGWGRAFGGTKKRTASGTGPKVTAKKRTPGKKKASGSKRAPGKKK